jgi:PAS domain S-box-containing protein
MVDFETGFQMLSTVVQTISDVEQPLDEKIQSVLEIAADELDFPIAYFTDIDDQTQRIVASVGDHDEVTKGTVDPLEQTYCRKTVETESPMMIADAEAEGWEDDPAYQKFGFSCYIGAPVTVADDTYGTICFADDSSRPEIDSAILKPTVESLARIIGYEIARTHAEEEVQQQEQRYRNLFEKSPDPVLVLDLDGIRECNEAARELFAVESREQLRDQEPGDLSPPTQPDGTESAGAFADYVETACEDGGVFFTWQFRRPSGELLHTEVQLSPIDFAEETLFHTHIRDITERKERQQDLRLYEKALEQAGHGVVITDREGKIEYVNPAYERNTGYDAEDILGKNPRFAKSGKHDESFYEDLWETITAGDIWETEELINRRRSGELYHVDQTIAPITDDGEITHFVGIQNEITDLRLREQRLDVLNRILRHNLRNSLTVIEGNLLGIESMFDPDDELMAYLSRIRNRIDQLTAFSNKAAKLQTLIDDSSDGATQCDVKSVIDSVVTEYATEYPEASISTTVPEDEVIVSQDNGIEFAVTEAVENGIVHNDNDTAETEVSIELLKLPTWVVIRVKDNGPGIPKQDRESLEIGEETDITHGSGFGLWAIYWILKASGGDIHISDNNGSGTVIDMMVPRSGEQLSAAGDTRNSKSGEAEPTAGDR